MIDIDQIIADLENAQFHKPMKTDTPETDAMLESTCGDYDDHAAFTRKLERQRDTAIAALIELRDAPWLNLPGRAGELIEAAIAAVKGGE